MTICGRCGQDNPEGFRYCGRCGAELEAPALREARKTVTVLFCDVTGSTELGERLDPEVLRGIMRRYFEAIEEAVGRHGGTVEKFIGDAAMAVFGVPRVEEDDALRAVRAAVEIRDRLPLLAAELGVALAFRTGVHTGEVVVGGGHTLATGDAINVAARLEQAAPPGEILIGADTFRLVRDAVEAERLAPLSLKGKSEPVVAYRLVSADSAAPGVARRLDQPLVGRDQELALLHGAYDRATVERSCHLFTLLGPAGVGKSRLAAELIARIGASGHVLHGRCLHYGEGITFWPLVEALLPLGERAAGVLRRIEDGGASAPEELFWDVRRLLEDVAAERAAVLVIDDLQWAEPMLVDLLDHVSDLSRGSPILLLCLARPELLEARPGWGGGKLNATTVLLEPLPAEACETLLDQLGDGLDPATRAEIIAASEGNPLFLEEMVALAHEHGGFRIPPTIHALLAARLERLDEGERTVLELGAVEGEVFHRAAVSALATVVQRPLLQAHLAALVRKELIRPHPATLAAGEAFRFRHLLIRDAAYDALPKDVRADLHERFADWLERVGAGLAEIDEMVGWHLEQAAAYHRELGRAADGTLERRAAERLVHAGRRALSRPDYHAAASLLRRALALLGQRDPRRPRLAVDLAEALISSGAYAEADALLDEAAADPSARDHATLTRILGRLSAQPEEGARMARDEVPALVERLRADGDERGMARAYVALLHAHWLEARAALAAAAALRALEHADRAGDGRLRSLALGLLSGPLVHGPAGPEEMRRGLALIEAADAGPIAAFGASNMRLWLALLEGRVEDAPPAVEEEGGILGAVGMTVLEAASGQDHARIEMAAGRPEAAAAILERAADALGRLGDRGYRSTVMAQLSDARYACGDLEGAEAAAREAEALSAPEDVINFAITRGVLAAIASDRAEHDEAEALANEAVRWAFESDFPVIRGDALMRLAAVLAAAGRTADARPVAERGLECYERKGDRLNAARAREVLESLPA